MAKRTRIQKPKLTANQAAFEKERRRLMRGVRRWEREGYIFSEGFAITRPARVTQKVLRQIRSLKPADLLKYATAVGEGGEIISGEIAYQERRREAIRKGQQTRRLRKIRRQAIPEDQLGEPGVTGEIPTGEETSFYFVYTEFIQRLSQPVDERRPRNVVELSKREQSSLLSLTDQAVANEGRAEIGRRLEAVSDRVWDLINAVLYASNESDIMSASTELAGVILGRRVTLKEKLDLGDESEENETWSNV